MKSFHLVGRTVNLSWTAPQLMGIVNVTPDSFSDGGRDIAASVAHAQDLIAAGAHWLDIGGESTRPGAAAVDATTELARVLPVVQAVRAIWSGPISVDTRKASVAQAVLAAGANIINDVSAGQDPHMLAVCAAHGAPMILMHMQGEPQTMQNQPQYQDVVTEVANFLQQAAQRALAAGVPSVMIDPGIGFGKTLAHNLALIRELPQLVALGYPVLFGASRKRLIDQIAQVPNPQNRDAGSLAVHLAAVQGGVAALRVHNVDMHAQALQVWKTLWEK